MMKNSPQGIYSRAELAAIADEIAAVLAKGGLSDGDKKSGYTVVFLLREVATTPCNEAIIKLKE